MITKCILRLVPKPEASLSVLVPFGDLQTGISAVLDIIRVNAGPAAVEFAERSVVQPDESFTGVSFPYPGAGAYIILMFDGRKRNVEDSAALVREVALKAAFRSYLSDMLGTETCICA